MLEINNRVFRDAPWPFEKHHKEFLNTGQGRLFSLTHKRTLGNIILVIANDLQTQVLKSHHSITLLYAPYIRLLNGKWHGYAARYGQDQSF